MQFSLVLQGLTSNPAIDSLEDITVASNILCFLGHGGVYSANSSDYSSAYRTSTNNPSYGTILGTVYGEGGDNGDPKNIIASMGNYVIWGEGSRNSYSTSLRYRTATSNSGTSIITLPSNIDHIYGVANFSNKIILCTNDGFYYSTSINGTYTKATNNTGNTVGEMKHFNEINGRLYATATWTTGSHSLIWYTDDGITWNNFSVERTSGEFYINDYAVNNNIVLFCNRGYVYRSVNNNTPSRISQSLSNIDYYNGYFYGYYQQTIYRSTDGNSWSSIYTFTDTDVSIDGQFTTNDTYIITKANKSYIFNPTDNTVREIPKIPIDQEGVFRKPYRDYNGKKVSLINTKTVAIFKE